MNHRRTFAAALAVSGLLGIVACGDPDSPRQEAQAQPERGALEATQRAAEAHREFQQAYAKDHVVYAPASPDQIERRAVAAAETRVHYRPVSADQIERRAVEAASNSASPWWLEKR
jgi:hypothetical protein